MSDILAIDAVCGHGRLRGREIGVPSRRAPHHMEHTSMLHIILYVVERWLTK